MSRSRNNQNVATTMTCPPVFKLYISVTTLWGRPVGTGQAQWAGLVSLKVGPGVLGSVSERLEWDSEAGTARGEQARAQRGARETKDHMPIRILWMI